MARLTGMSQVSLELVDRGPDESRSTVPLDFDDEYVGVVTVLELNTSVYGMTAPEQVVASNRIGLQVGDLPEWSPAARRAATYKLFTGGRFFIVC